MSVQAAICEVLAANADVVALVEQRIRPSRMDPNDPRPFVVVKATETPWKGLSGGRAKSGEAKLFMTAVSESTEAEAHAIAEAVRAAVSKFRGLKSDRIITAAWEDDTEGDWDPVQNGGCDGDWWLETVGFVLNWKRPE
ncbi:DUF3168 domain-containing protein [Planctomyces sp. SH-PL14]|uniref:tail completion protein gp17 n=1 Tax=Planctomyces sp. SH-PL14 TaxID=1632864 RepID=UPI00078E168B|nr:DUF3168 domain-containing protein [Planctomyces sp. SH-PL14]AMV18257.1 hypothetical protein VT03_10235 [Planctomyces sp. SH-PL14]